MSAYLCDFATFDYLATACKQWDVIVHLGNVSPERRVEVASQFPFAMRGESLGCRGLGTRDVGRILWAENLRSINYRYPDTLTNRADMPGNMDEVTEDYRFRPIAVSVEAVNVLSVAACLEYQSCESDDWSETVACAILKALCRAAIRHLPGYDDAPWGMTDAHVRPTRSTVETVTP